MHIMVTLSNGETSPPCELFFRHPASRVWAWRKRGGTLTAWSFGYVVCRQQICEDRRRFLLPVSLSFRSLKNNQPLIY